MMSQCKPTLNSTGYQEYFQLGVPEKDWVLTAIKMFFPEEELKEQQIEFGEYLLANMNGDVSSFNRHSMKKFNTAMNDGYKSGLLFQDIIFSCHESVDGSPITLAKETFLEIGKGITSNNRTISKNSADKIWNKNKDVSHFWLTVLVLSQIHQWDEVGNVMNYMCNNKKENQNRRPAKFFMPSKDIYDWSYEENLADEAPTDQFMNAYEKVKLGRK